MTRKGYNSKVDGHHLKEWEKDVVLPIPPNAPYVPCPKCNARQWIREPVGYTCLTCGKEVFTVSDGVLLRRYPYNDGDKNGAVAGHDVSKEHPKRRSANFVYGVTY